MEEIWASVVGYEGLYEVSTLGQVRSVTKYQRGVSKGGKETHRLVPGKVIKQRDNNGYRRIDLYNGRGVAKRYFVHRLVAEAFIPNPNNYPQINHKDENKSNNSADNLEWCTVSYNNTYGSLMQRRRENCIRQFTGRTLSEEHKRVLSIRAKEQWRRQKGQVDE